MGVVQSLDRGNVIIKLCNRMLTTSVGVCIPITKELGSQSADSAPGKNSMRVGEQITHFISLDLTAVRVVKSIQALQEDLGHIEKIGSPMKATSLHITMAVLAVKEGELEQVIVKTKKAAARFLDILQEKHVFLLTCGGVGFGDYGALWLKVNIGEELFGIL